MQQSPQSRPLDAIAIVVTIGLCLTWGFNQVAIKFALHDIPPLIQSAARSAVAALCVATYAQVRGIALFKRDGTLWAGVVAGVLFAVEFLLVYRDRLYNRYEGGRCADLRQACLHKGELGEQGMGNCQRYRAMCH